MVKISQQLDDFRCTSSYFNSWTVLYILQLLPNEMNAQTVCQSFRVLNMYVSCSLHIYVCMCAPSPLTCLSRPPACQHASTSHTLALGRSGSTRDVPAKSSSTSNLDPNTCNTKPWQPPTSHYPSYSIYRRYTSLTEALYKHLSSLTFCISARLEWPPCVLCSLLY